MAQKTTLAPYAWPGRVYNFVAKEEAAPVEIDPFRTWDVPAESRVYAVEEESRVYVVKAESRVYVVA